MACRRSTDRPLAEVPTSSLVLSKQGQPQHLRPQGCPPTSAANGGGSSNTAPPPVAGLSKPPGPAAPSAPGAVVANNGPPMGAPVSNSSRGAPGSGGHASPGTMQYPKGGQAPAAVSVPGAAATTATGLAQSPIAPHRIIRKNTSGRGSGGAGGGGELARSPSGAADGREDWGATPSGAMGGAGARPVTAAGGEWHAGTTVLCIRNF